MKNWYSICALNDGAEISIYDEIGAYVDVAIERWQQFTGQDAVLDGADRSCDEIAAERVAAWMGCRALHAPVADLRQAEYPIAKHVGSA